MRGEDRNADWTAANLGGSPPHARGRPFRDGSAAKRARITPACAGKTLGAGVFPGFFGDHPRMRGEDVR